MDTPSILSSLSPLIAIVSSPDVDGICLKNGLTDIVEVLRPFEKGLERVSLRTTQLATITAPTFPLRFTTLDFLERQAVHSPATDKTDLILDSIGAIISRNAKKWEEEVEVQKVEGVEGLDERYLGKSVETLTPWYATFRDVVLKTRPVSEHETFNHPVAVILAISSSNRDPMNAMAKLYDRLNQSKFYGQRPFMDPSVLRYFVVVHDVGGGVDLEEAQKLLSSIKRTYGLHSTLLPINSLSPTLPSSPFLHQLYSKLPPSDPTTVLTNTHPPASPIATAPSTPIPTPRSTPAPQVPVSPSPSPRKAKREDDHPLGLGQEDDEDNEKSGEAGKVEEEEGEVYLGGRLTDVDVGSLRGFVREMAVKSLIPFMEKKVGEWNELFVSSRRGLTGRLFGAGRKFFGSSRPASPAAGSGSGTGGLAGFNVSKGYYPHQSAEAVSRRLADFAFVLRDYRFAASVYDSIRKDYASDKAYRYQAGANEMFGLSIIMTTPPRTRLDVDPFLEQAVLTYQSRGTLQLDAMRSTLLYYEGYRTIGEWRSVGTALLRAAGEAEEIPSAILLEQAALADLRLPKPAMRRYAFHLVMAAQRYEKCGQKSFSRRCLEQSILLYRKQTWTRAQTHVEHALGRQAYTMGESDLAVNHFVRLLKGEQGAFLEDFVLAFEHLSTQNPEKIATLSDELPQPVFDQKRTSILSLSGTSSHKGTDPKWAELQERFLEVGYTSSDGKKPRELLYSGGENIMSVDEPFLVELVSHNPLDASLSLGNVTVEAVVVSSDSSLPKVAPEGLEIEVIPEILLEPGETRRISLTVKGTSIQTIEFTHVTFAFHKLLPCRQPLARRGKRLHSTKAQRLTPAYAPDTSLAVSVRPPRPNLAISLDGLPLALGQGESTTVVVELSNAGGAALRDLRLLVSDPSVLSVVGGEEEEERVDGSSSKASGSSSRISIPNDLFITRPSEIVLPNGALQPGETLSISVLCHGQYLGAKEILLLFVYQTCDESSTTFSSTIAHTLSVEPVVRVYANHRPSSSRPGNHLLALEIESLSSEPVRISQVSALSPLWETSSPGGRSSALNHLLSANQSHRSFLTISQSSPDPSSPRQDMQFTATKLQRLLAGSTVKPSLPSPINLLLSPPPESESTSTSSAIPLPPLFLTSKRDSRLAYLSSQYPLIPLSDLPHIFPLFEPRDLDILLFWEIPSQGRSGYLLISGMTPGPSESIFLGLEVDGGKGERVVRSMFEATDTAKKALASSILDGRLGLEEDPVRVSVVGQEQVGWDFGGGPCLVPVTFSIANTSTTLSTWVTFSIQEPPPTSLLQPSFAGSLTHQAIIPPSSSSLFNASFVAARPGIYNVAGWHLAVETGQEASESESEEGEEEDRWKGRKWFEQVPREEKRVRVLEEVSTTRRMETGGGEGLVAATA